MHLQNRKLTYSTRGFQRAVQMSSAALFVYVEGPTDRSFFSRIISILCNGKRIRHRVVTSQELPRAGGGKQSLLFFHDQLRRRKKLVDRFKGKTTVTVFYADKDVDDFRRSLKKSRHFIYTRYYEVENYLFKHGDLPSALSAACGLDLRSVQKAIPNSEVWMERVANHWRPWVELCLYSRIRGVGCECSYSCSQSSIHAKEGQGPLLKRKYKLHVQAIQARTGLSPEAFQRSFDRHASKVAEIYQQKNQDLIFKGKWYSSFIMHEALKASGGRRIHKNGLKERVLSCLELTLAYDEEWAEHLRDPVEELLQLAGV